MIGMVTSVAASIGADAALAEPDTAALGAEVDEVRFLGDGLLFPRSESPLPAKDPDLAGDASAEAPLVSGNSFLARERDLGFGVAVFAPLFGDCAAACSVALVHMNFLRSTCGDSSDSAFRATRSSV